VKFRRSALSFIFSLSLVGTPLHAAEHAIRVTTFLVSHAGVPDGAAGPIMQMLDSALQRNPRLEMKELDTRLSEIAQEAPEEQIAEGRRLRSEAEAALAALQLSTALHKLEQAVEVLSKVLPFIKKEELADAMMALGATQYLKADRRSGHATFVRLFTWRPDYQADATRYSSQVLAPLEEARREVEKTRRGSLEIRSEPSAAQAYVDGRYVGVTPTTAEGLVAGEHFVTWKHEGYRKAVRPALVSVKQQELVTASLERTSKYLLVEEALRSAERQLGSDSLNSGTDRLREVLFIDHAVFVRLRTARPGFYNLEADLYDLRSRKRLGRVLREVPTQGGRAVEDVAAALYLNVRYEAELVAPGDEASTETKRKPFYKTWWFWTVTGLTAGGLIATGAALGTMLKPKDCSGAFCPEFRLQ
jgi:hypothetical protein